MYQQQFQNCRVVGIESFVPKWEIAKRVGGGRISRLLQDSPLLNAMGEEPERHHI